MQRTHVRTPLRSRQDFSEYIAGHIGEAIAASVVEAGQSLVIHAEQMEQGDVEIVYTHTIRFGFVAEVTRLPMPWKMPGLAV